MNQIQFILLGFMIVGFFGSLSLFTPSIIWKDFTVFFRKEKKKNYLAYSNHYLGKLWLSIGLFSLILLITYSLFHFKINAYLLAFLYILYFVLMRILIEINWQKQKNQMH